MKNAIIYTRVSTDDQAKYGYSLNSQKELLIKYCQVNNINIVAHYQDDYSAKTFNRPEFNKLLEFAKSNKNLIDTLLVVRWDRFSRNVTDALNMIRVFDKIGIEIKTVEQSLDIRNCPDDKLMLSIYLTIPEVENDRRAKNTRQGMIKAMKEGRWISNAPLGYKNIRDAEDKPLLLPNEKAPLIKEMFEKLATGSFNQEEIRREYNQKGLKISKSHINRIFINPAYIGKIRIPVSNNEPEMIVEALHTPIVSEDIFIKVQDILNASKKKGKALKPKDPNLPLRHHLKCPCCGRNLTGSASKGNGGKYYYYHCQRGCNTRYKADLAHSDFQLYLQGIKIKTEIAELYKEIVKDVFSEADKEQNIQRKKIEKDIETNKEKLSKIDNLLIDGKIDGLTHKRMIEEANKRINQLATGKMQFQFIDTDYKNYLGYGFNLLENIDKFYSEADLEIKDKLISSVFPDRLIYQNGNYRTNGTDNIISLLCGNFAETEATKTGNTVLNNQHSPNGSAYGDRTRTFRLERAAC